MNAVTTPSCRFCEAPLEQIFADLRATPLANSLLRQEDLQACEPTYPLLARVCDACRLVQLDEFESPEHIFGDYLYFSSYSPGWLAHAKEYSVQMTRRFGIDASSTVMEVASNDGYLLQNFLGVAGKVLGIEPARNVARVAQEAGIETLSRFFGVELGKELADAGQQADLIAANNVLAHVPDLNDFVAGFGHLLKEDGVLTVEFPHLLELIRHCQFDTIYHEHFSYFSLFTAEQVFAKHGLNIFDVERLPTHGGSLRLFVQVGSHHADTGRAAEIIAEEEAAGIRGNDLYASFEKKIRAIKRNTLRFLFDAAEAGKQVAAYGAAAKGNTFLNYCGIGTDLISCVADASPHKQDRYLPGSRIPVISPETLRQRTPDYVLILPWNLRTEISEQLADMRATGCKLVTAIPTLEIES